MIYYHNPRCSKSRQGLALLEEAGVKYEVKEYLKEGLTQKEIKELAQKLDKDVIEFTRVKEATFKENAPEGKSTKQSELIKLMAKFPVLLERPILVKGKKAVIGRPPEDLNELLK